MELGSEGMGGRATRVEFANATDLANGVMWYTWVTGEAFPRSIFKADGNILKGNGTVAPT